MIEKKRLKLARAAVHLRRELEHGNLAEAKAMNGYLLDLLGEPLGGFMEMDVEVQVPEGRLLYVNVFGNRPETAAVLVREEKNGPILMRSDQRDGELPYLTKAIADVFYHAKMRRPEAEKPN